MFIPVNPKQSFPQMEEDILAYWKANKTFEKSVRGKKKYSFYDGPPFATGLPHYGHLLTGTLKDVVPRYWAMKGYNIERRWGWDCHGLPVENEVEKMLGLKSKTAIEEYGIPKFNEACRAIVMKYAEEWKKTVERMGRWVDMENDYKTMSPDYMESIWWVFKSLWEKKLIYEGNKIVPYCIRCATPLSNFETNQGYKDRQDPALTVKFELADEPGTYLLAWTTTPWTLPSNLALAVGKKITYAKIQDANGDRYILALNRIPHFYKNPADYQVLEEMLGETLEGRKYIPLLPYYAGKKERNAFTVTTGDFVSLEDGTGLVHMAPFGEDDMVALKKMGVEAVYPLDAEGKFNAEVKEYEGKDVFTANPEIIQQLKNERKIVKHETINHSYPFCWRCDTPLIYRPISTWFVNVESLKSKLVKTNQKINWVPEHLKDGRFGKWLEGARDWAISRNRYWGTPLPIWRCEKCDTLKVMGSIQELEEACGKKVADLHKHFVDELTLKCDCGKTMRRVPEVLDCWFESGSMPYAQLHYPFENKEKFEKNFPAEFIAEGVDQTRGWFYTLHVLSNALFGKPAFKNVVVNGTVLAEDGQKMSKRLKNYPDPNAILSAHGADALRFYLMNSPVVKADDMRFSEKGVSDVVRNMILPLWNSYSFFVTYANIDGWKPAGVAVGAETNPRQRHARDTKSAFVTYATIDGWKPTVGAIRQSHRSANKLDQWILQELNKLIIQQIQDIEAYDLQKASNSIYKFVDDLTNWYIRRSRRRFWKNEDDGDKSSAYATLFEVLTTLCKVIAPFMPFVSEEIYRNLTGEESVHLTAYPKPTHSPESANDDSRLQEEMFLAKTVVSLGLAARSKLKIKVRQPLRKIQVALGGQFDSRLLKDQIEIIKEELNVKEVELIQDATAIATVVAKANAKLLGPKYGKEVQFIIQAAKTGQFERLPNGNIRITVGADGNPRPYELTPEEIEIAYVGKEGFNIETEAGLLVALDTVITPELQMEGEARDLVRMIQDLRKAAKYKVSDRISIALINVKPELIATFGETIKAETLATSIEPDLQEPDQFGTQDGITVKIKR